MANFFSYLWLVFLFAIAICLALALLVYFGKLESLLTPWISITKTTPDLAFPLLGIAALIGLVWRIVSIQVANPSYFTQQWSNLVAAVRRPFPRPTLVVVAAFVLLGLGGISVFRVLTAKKPGPVQQVDTSEFPEDSVQGVPGDYITLISTDPCEAAKKIQQYLESAKTDILMREKRALAQAKCDHRVVYFLAIPISTNLTGRQPGEAIAQGTYTGIHDELLKRFNQSSQKSPGSVILPKLYNNNGTEAGELKAAKAIIANKKVLAVIGPMNSKLAAISLPLYKAAGLEVIPPTLTNQDYCADLLCPSAQPAMSAKLFVHLASENRAAWKIVRTDEIYSSNMAQSVRDEAGSNEPDTIVGKDGLTEQQKQDLGALTNNDMIFLFTGETQGKALLQELETLKLKPKIVAGDGIFSEQNLKATSMGYLIINQFSKDFASQLGFQRLIKRFDDLYGAPLGPRSAMAARAVQIFLALTNNLPSNPTRAMVVEEHAKLKGKFLEFGQTRYEIDANGGLINPLLVVTKVLDKTAHGNSLYDCSSTCIEIQ
jgi:ABC-type branched-subunit amino acid transport system substrate-binding protein